MIQMSVTMLLDKNVDLMNSGRIFANTSVRSAMQKYFLRRLLPGSYCKLYINLVPLHWLTLHPVISHTTVSTSTKASS
jgi:hypothetical protein